MAICRSRFRPRSVTGACSVLTLLLVAQSERNTPWFNAWVLNQSKDPDVRGSKEEQDANHFQARNLILYTQYLVPMNIIALTARLLYLS